MEQITVTAGSSALVAANFTAGEFHSKSLDAPQQHPFSTLTIEAVQAVRDFWGVPTSVTSSHRTYLGNVAVGGGFASQHLGYGAADIQPSSSSLRSEKMKEIYDDMACKGPLYQQLKAMGVKGVGIYNTFLHLDDGTYPGNPRSFMTFWDQSDFEPVKVTTAYMNTVPESGNPNCENGTFSPSEETVSQYSKKKV